MLEQTVFDTTTGLQTLMCLATAAKAIIGQLLGEV